MTYYTYWISQSVLLEWPIVDADGVPVTSGVTVAGTVTLPDLTTSAVTASYVPAAGLWRAVYDPQSAGDYGWRLTATGVVDGAQAGTFRVLPDPAAAPSVVTDPTLPVGQVRLLIPDRDLPNLLFTDADIAAFLALNSANPRRAAAEALETIASNEAMVSKVIRTQDLTTDGAKVSAELRARAVGLRAQADVDDASADTDGGMYIVDWAPDDWPWSAELCEPET